MAIITYPLNNIDYQAEDAELFHCTRTSGIYASGHFPVSVSGLDNDITIGKGIGWIRNTEFSGKVFASKESITLNAGVPDASLPRIDAVVIQFDANANETNIIIKQGTTGSTPTAPEVERGEYIYELHMYHIRRKAGATAITPGDITDLRMDANYCGLMADSVTQVDMSAINAQVREFISDWESQIANVTDGKMVESPEYPGCYYRLNGGVVEWLNPPMMVGKEYRLSQRDDGKRVYAKMVKFESIKGYSELAVSGVEKIVSISAVVERLLTDSSGRTFFQVPCSDVPPETDRVAALNRTQVYFYDSKICVDFAMRRGRYDLYVTINYTRSDDVEYTSAYADGDSLYIDTSGATTKSGSTVATELYATVDSDGGEYVNSFVINGKRYDLATNLADSGEPSSSLPGNVGQIYTDLDTKKTYVCISANSTSGDYKWVPVVSDPFYTSELRLKHGTGIRFSKIVADESKIEIKNPISDTIIRGVATPTSDNDAANKAYVDSKVGSGSGQNVDLTEAINTALAQAKASGEFDGKDGYTPVRGVDYWSPTDIAEIKAYVDEAILGGAW